MLPNIPVTEGASVLLAASLVWASALVQHLTNVIKRGARYVMSDRSVAPNMEGFFGRAEVARPVVDQGDAHEVIS